MDSNKNDYEHMLFYFAYKTFIKTADEIIEKYDMSRQHHRFLFFINKLPGITIKQLLKTLEISKQGSHATLRKLKEEGLIVEQTSEEDRRVKQLFPTPKGSKLVDKLNKAQNELMQRTFQNVGHDWYDIMEELSIYREGFQDIQHLKDEK
ncbi:MULTISPECIES: MarR family winged helix-turn-helix transcriptional regulator [Staphylococcus]|uniref:MarR family winged helix-turn-helix transcriptional regulator n=1 Tax=Staphylococcus TaxID=1279 RepID=UPI0002F288BD|nr:MULTISPECIES: MarR family winged helix-turn-helix transcriptional regulator [Staphylococcus]MBC3102113.1 winged helix-turn-helix transcriptional regulator [Staphylococcus haemolyticus]MBC3143055.1 winged helix-turn-helix transcriptional regulator [Staphylococcus haemolyticus]MBO0384067.1 winged helix-turn-helix transcriptional regulator [Staphylococcus haemolyticus]MCH4427354.1 MarR family winged helix-turn-helix transcriptional regulator [Staphylococcus haemolyticus]MCH4448473.1 MarR famil